MIHHTNQIQEDLNLKGFNSIDETEMLEDNFDNYLALLRYVTYVHSSKNLSNMANVLFNVFLFLPVLNLIYPPFFL